MSDDKKRVECPVCGKDFLKSMINMHVDTCLNSQSGTSDVEILSDTGNSSPRATSAAKRPKISEQSGKISSAGASQAGKPSANSQHSRQAWKNIFTSKSSSEPDSKKGRPTEPGGVLSNVDTHFSQLSRMSLTNPSAAPSFEQLAKAAIDGGPVERDKNSNKVLSVPVKLDLTKLDVSPKNKGKAHTEVSQSKNENRLKTNSKENKNAQGLKSQSAELGQSVPLSEQMRPRSLEEFVGQVHLLGKNKMLRTLLVSYQIPSMILWGPPGCGKTTLARIIAERCKELSSSRFVKLSATTSGMADVREAIKQAKNERKLFKRKTILFIDEIHRFNKLQQDTFLPHVEDGTITLIGATTENPGFQVNNALLSRCRVIILEKLTTENVIEIISRSAKAIDVEIIPDGTDIGMLEHETDASKEKVNIETKAIATIAGLCDGDARSALNCFQTAVNTCRASLTTPVPELSFPPGVSGAGPFRRRGVIGVEDVKEALQRTHLQYDIAGEEHYNCASALQKSIRGSDANGAIYWVARMLEGGEDPLFIARRLLVCASEDIGLADPQALTQAVSTFQTCNFLGAAESKYALAQCTVYLARAPKSIEAWTALSRAQESIKTWEGAMPGVPLHLRNATNKVTREAGYGKGYQYSHNYKGNRPQSYLPKEVQGTDFFKDSS